MKEKISRTGILFLETKHGKRIFEIANMEPLTQDQLSNYIESIVGEDALRHLRIIEKMASDLTIFNTEDTIHKIERQVVEKFNVIFKSHQDHP